MTPKQVAQELRNRGVTSANSYAEKDKYTVEQLTEMFFDIMDLQLNKTRSIHDACINYEGHEHGRPIAPQESAGPVNWDR